MYENSVHRQQKESGMEPDVYILVAQQFKRNNGGGIGLLTF